MMTCSLGSDGIATYKDTCSFKCNAAGFVLTGSDTRTCKNDRSWSGYETMCGKGGTFINVYACFIMKIFLIICRKFVLYKVMVINFTQPGLSFICLLNLIC